MAGRNRRCRLAPALGCRSAGRLAAAFLLPNAEQDGYSYAEMTARFSQKLSAGNFHLTDLFGFWPPLFQFIAAIPNLWIQDGLIAGQAGQLRCRAQSPACLVFAVARRLTRSVGWACLAYLLVLVNPLHILYSGSSMSDVPHACLVIASLWFALERRWMIAAICGMVAEGMRMEAWTLLASFAPDPICRWNGASRWWPWRSCWSLPLAGWASAISQPAIRLPISQTTIGIRSIT